MVYKFYSADGPMELLHLLKALLENQTLRSSMPLTFNDPFECKFLISLEGSREEKRARYFQDNPRLSEGDFDYWCDGLGLNTRYMEEQIRAQLICTGVTSFTLDWNHHLLWSHYARNHAGFCIGYDEEILRRWSMVSASGPVSYSERAPEHHVFLEPREEYVRKAMFNKAECWRYENEWRLFFNQSGDFQHPAGAIQEVILGCRAPMNVQDFGRWQYDRPDGIRFYQAYEVQREYRIDRHAIARENRHVMSYV